MWVALAHHEQHFAAWIHGSGRPPFLELTMSQKVSHTVPLITYSLPSRRIKVWIFVASELDTDRSVIENADRKSPFNRGTSHFFFCSGDPYFANTSIFPVSGAAQFVAY
jgi:hypothetical protein